MSAGGSGSCVWGCVVLVFWWVGFLVLVLGLFLVLVLGGGCYCAGFRCRGIWCFLCISFLCGVGVI